MNYIKLFDNKEYTIDYKEYNNNLEFNFKEYETIVKFLFKNNLISRKIFNSFFKEYEEYEKIKKLTNELLYCSDKMELLVTNYIIVLNNRYSHATISKIDDDFYLLNTKGINYKCDQLNGLKICISDKVIKYHI